MPQQVLQEHELLRRKLDLSLAVGDRMMQQVHRQLSVTEHRFVSVVGSGAAHHRTNACDQFVGAEGLRKIVVRPEIEAEDPIRFFGARRDDDDREPCGGAISPQGAADLEATHARQHEIEDDDVEGFAPRVRERLIARFGEVSGPAGLLDVMRNQLCDVAVIFGDENPDRLGQLGFSPVESRPDSFENSRCCLHSVTLCENFATRTRILRDSRSAQEG